jgi:hypothetical protein
MDRQLVAGFNDAAQLIDVRHVEVGFHALAEQVHRQRDQVDVAGALAVAEQRAFDPFRAGHQGQLGGGDRGAAIVVGVHAQDEAVPLVDVSMAPFDLVRIDVRCAHLDRRRKVEDHLLVRGRLPHVDDRIRDLLGKVELGAREALGRILEYEFRRPVVGRQPLDQLGAADRDRHDALSVEAEDHPALQLRGRVVEVHDGSASAHDALEGPLDQLVPGLGENLDRDVIGDQVLLDEHAYEVEVGL